MDERKVPIGKRALIARINRALAKEGKVLRLSRGNAERSGLGYAYILDAVHNVVEAHGIEDLSALAREVGVLKDFEELTED